MTNELWFDSAEPMETTQASFSHVEPGGIMLKSSVICVIVRLQVCFSEVQRGCPGKEMCERVLAFSAENTQGIQVSAGEVML